MKNMKVLPLFATCLLSWSTLSLAAEKVDKTLKVKASPTVDIDIKRGQVVLQGWKKSSIQVRGTLDEKSEGLIFEQKDGRIVIEDKLERHFNMSNKSGSKLTIHLPQSLTLDTDGVSTDYQVKDLSGKLLVQTVSGDIVSDKLADKVELRSVSGDISATQNKGELLFSTVSGSIQDQSSQGKVHYRAVSGEINANSDAANVDIEQVSGDAELSLLQVKQLALKSVSGDVDALVNGDVQQVTAESVSADMNLNFTHAVNAHVEIDGGPGGDIENKLTQDKPVKSRYSGSESIQFTVGAGKGSIKMSTISGNMHLQLSDKK